MILVRLDVERHEVARIGETCGPKLRPDFTGSSDHPQIDIPGRPCPFDAELERQTSFEGDVRPERRGHSGEETIEHEALPATLQLASVPCGCPETALQRLFEALRRIRTSGHSVSPP